MKKDQFPGLKAIKQCFFVLVVCCFMQISVVAQPIDDPPLDDPGGGGGGDPDLVPIDGGLVFLLAAGLVYGSKKGMAYKKKQ
jgi:hypothetical protein